MLVLSLFPGIGLLDHAFELEGFCVVRGPDVLWGGDVRRFHPPVGRFDGVIGGPPCQAFSRLRVMVEHNGHKTAENLIPEFERVVYEAQPSWFLMENVPGAPEPSIPDLYYWGTRSYVVNNRWFGAEQNRERRFSWGMRREVFPNGHRALDISPDMALFEAMTWEPAIIASGGGKPNKLGIRDITSKAGVAESLRLQGLPPDFFAHSPFKIEAQQRVIGNGVPIPMGRAIARAVRRALALPIVSETEAVS